MDGEVTLSVDQEQWDVLCSFGNFAMFNQDMDYFLQKMTQSGNDDATVDTMGVQLGLPPNLSALLNKIKTGTGSISISDGQISAKLEMHSAGLGLFLKALIRVIATTDSHNEMAYF